MLYHQPAVCSSGMLYTCTHHEKLPAATFSGYGNFLHRQAWWWTMNES
jgi:hypothetical protein